MSVCWVTCKPGRLARLLVVLGLWLCTMAAFAAPRIGVVTMLPGEIFWERFGHNAILVADPATGAGISYNFGFFDPTEPDFLARFIRGNMRYRLAALPIEQDLAVYRDEGRGVSVQWLDLDDAQAQSLADALAVNARPENAHYRYDYFLDNCSTRVRDAIDRSWKAIRRAIHSAAKPCAWCRRYRGCGWDSTWHWAPMRTGRTRCGTTR